MTTALIQQSYRSWKEHSVLPDYLILPLTISYIELPLVTALEPTEGVESEHNKVRDREMDYQFYKRNPHVEKVPQTRLPNVLKNRAIAARAMRKTFHKCIVEHYHSLKGERT